MNDAGNRTVACERAIVTTWSSSGWRSVSSTVRGNSASSSRNSTPWCASEISPARGTIPPPTTAAELAVWCGVRTGRVVTSPCPCAIRPAAE